MKNPRLCRGVPITNCKVGSLQEVKLENKALRQVSTDYERVKRVFGPEQIEAAVVADKQREQAEKVRKRASRQEFRLDVR